MHFAASKQSPVLFKVLTPGYTPEKKKKTLWAEPSTAPPPLGRAEPNPQTLSIASVWADQPGSTAPVWPVRGRGKRV